MKKVLNFSWPVNYIYLNSVTIFLSLIIHMKYKILLLMKWWRKTTVSMLFVVRSPGKSTGTTAYHFKNISQCRPFFFHDWNINSIFSWSFGDCVYHKSCSTLYKAMRNMIESNNIRRVKNIFFEVVILFEWF